MSDLVVLGVDPGARQTGIVVRRGHELLTHIVVPRIDDSVADYAKDVLRACSVYEGQHLPTVVDDFNGLVAIEGVRPPSPHVRVIDVGPLLDACFVAGYVHAGMRIQGRPVVVVPPGGHGAGALSSYPAALVSDAERRHGLTRAAGSSSVLRHCRAAYDVAVVGERLWRAGRVAS
ncbi:MAG TPA: hypothetical protein VFI46_10355 [Jiangellaceae bacterium]|nr:hypothetical protein [Jiangellaceae bacterium]